MFRIVGLALLLVGLGARAAHADSFILWQQAGGGGYGEWPGYYVPPEDRWVQCTLEECGVVFGDDLYWYEPNSPYGPNVPGEHIWPDPNTPPEDWSAFVTCITNGSCDPMDICCGSSIGGMCLYSWCDPNLPPPGYQIDYLRLYVESIVYDGDPPHISFSCAAYWQIWGVPEPGSLLLLALGATLAGRCRR